MRPAADYYRQHVSILTWRLPTDKSFHRWPMRQLLLRAAFRQELIHETKKTKKSSRDIETMLLISEGLFYQLKKNFEVPGRISLLLTAEDLSQTDLNPRP